MKKIVTVIAAFNLVACATEFKIVSDDVPAVVADAFKSKYPNATKPVWEVEKHEGRLVYEAMFKADGKSKEAVFKPDGTFVAEE